MPTATILLTRPLAASTRFADALKQSGLTGVAICMAPLIEIAPTGIATNLTGTETIIFTSVNGVNAWRAHGGSSGRLAFVVGQATERAAQADGFETKSANGDAEALINLVRKSQPVGPLIHLRGRHSRGNIAARLTAAGVPTSEQIVYEQRKKDLTAEAFQTLAGPDPVIIPLFSPRTARLFAIANNAAAPLYIGCMSEAVATEIKGTDPALCLLAEHPDMKSMTKVVLDLVAASRSVEGSSDSM